MRARDFINEKRRKKKRNPATVLYYGYPWGWTGDSGGDLSESSDPDRGWTRLRLPNYPEDAYVKFQDGRTLIAGDNIEMEDDEVGKYWFSFTADLESGKVLKYDLGWHRDPPLDIDMVDVYSINDVVYEILEEVRKVWGSTEDEIRAELEGGFGIDESQHDSQWTDAVDRHTRMRALAKRQGDEEKFNYHHDELRKLYGKDMPTTSDGTFNDDPGGIKIDEIGVPPVSPVFPMRRELPKRTPHFPNPKKKISEDLTPEDAQQLWIKNYGEEMAERVFYNIKNELLHTVSDLKSIRASACDTQDRLEAMSRVEFARWLLTYFTDALEQYNWPEAHTEGIAQVIRDRVRQPLLNKQCLLEQSTTHGSNGYVYRIDSEHIPDFESDLKTYYHNKDFSVSGRSDFKGSVGAVKGVYAADKLFTALYATGTSEGGKRTRYVAIYGPSTPTVYFDRKDISSLKNNQSYLTVFDAKNFRKLPSGEYFSENPGKPIKQVKITDPFSYIKSQGWRIRLVDDLEKVLKQVQNLAKQHKIRYGAEGLGYGPANENFADGKKPGRKGLAKRMGVPTKASVSRLRQIAKSSSGEKARMAHWVANMKAGRNK